MVGFDTERMVRMGVEVVGEGSFVCPADGDAAVESILGESRPGRIADGFQETSVCGHRYRVSGHSTSRLLCAQFENRPVWAMIRQLMI